MSALTVAAEGTGPVALARGVTSAVQDLSEGADAAFAAGWAFDERAGVIGALDRAVELIALYRSRVLAAHKADGRWARAGDRSFESYRGRTARTGAGAARAEVELAEALAAVPPAVRAVEDGAVSLGHAHVLARLRCRASEPVRAALDAGGAAELLMAARELDVPTFTRRALAWAAARDADAAERSFEVVRARRYARVVDREGGTRIDAFVDPVVGASIRAALEAVTSVPAEGDDRTAEQRSADALAVLAARVLDAGSDKIGAQVRPHLSIIVPAETWAAVRNSRRGVPAPRAESETDADANADRAARGRADAGGRAGADANTDRAAGGGARAERGCGLAVGRRTASPTHDDDGPRRHRRGRNAGAGVAPGDRGRPGAAPRREEAGALQVPAELDDGTVVPLSELARIACDCELTRMVLDAECVPLDVGRTQRTYSKELRRAVLVRDGHCRWPGCTLRASWCEVHHVTWFSRGGATSADNALTLCVFHHHEVHRRNIQIIPATGGHAFTRADGTVIGTTTREHGIRRMVAPALESDANRDPTGPPERAGEHRTSTPEPDGELF